MIGDGRQIEDGRELATGVCIIGGGAAGITLAQALADSPLDVILLESGGMEFDTDTNGLNVGGSTGLPYFPLEAARLRYFGGSTNHWGGYCRRLEEVDFARRAWVPGSGWPIDREDLDPYYDRARPIVGLTGDEGAMAELIDSDRSRPIFDDASQLVHVLAEIVPRAMRPFGQRFQQRLEAADRVDVLLNANAVEIETDQDGRRVERVHVATLAGDRFTVRAQAVVLATGGIENPRLLLASDRVRRNGIGNERDLVGRYFIEHPRFVAGTLIPTRDDLHAGFYEPHEVGGRDLIGYLSLEESVLEAEGILEVQVRIRPTYDPAVEAAIEGEDIVALRDLMRRSPGGLDRFGAHVARVVTDLVSWQEVTVPGGPLPVPLPEVVEEVARRAVKGDLDGLLPLLLGDIATVGYREVVGLPIVSADLTTRIDPLPDPESRITLGSERDALGMRRAQLHWALSPLDKWSAIRTLEILGSELGREGLGRVRVLIEEDDDWPADLAGGWHHMGTTRMSDEPSTGVVDPDCRVHGMDDLYIAGSSVFPTGGSGTPTMTIVALALRLADHLRDRLA